MKLERSSFLNLLMLRQSYLVMKRQCGDLERLSELKQVHSNIEMWHAQECEKIKLQARRDEIDKGEKVRIYDHELHSKQIRKSSILQLQTDAGVIKGHDSWNKLS